MNIRIVDGRLVRDAVIKTDKNGVKFLTFVLANNQFVNKEKVATYYNVITYNNYDVKREEVNKVLTQGKFITVTGTPNENMSVKDGKTYLNRNIMADRIDFSVDVFKQDTEKNETPVYRDVAPATPHAETPQVETPQVNTPKIADLNNFPNQVTADISKIETKVTASAKTTAFDEDELPF